MHSYFYGCNVLTILLLLFGYTTTQDVAHIYGICKGISEAPVPCVMKEQPFGVKYVTDGESVYQLRPVFWGGFYSVSKDGSPLMGDQCKTRNNDIYCHNTVIFITNDD